MEKSKETVEFYDPHDGKQKCGGGFAIPSLPNPLLNVINGLNGKKMTLEKALERFESFTKEHGGEIEIVEESQYISLSIGPNMYNLINYR